MKGYIYIYIVMVDYTDGASWINIIMVEYIMVDWSIDDYWIMTNGYRWILISYICIMVILIAIERWIMENRWILEYVYIYIWLWLKIMLPMTHRNHHV